MRKIRNPEAPKRAPRFPAAQRRGMFFGRVGSFFYVRGGGALGIGVYSDGGPTDVDRKGKRARGKRQRQARRLNR